MKIKCDKCGGLNVENHAIKKPEEQVKTMTEYLKEIGNMRRYAVMTYTQMVLVCLDYGYRKEYTI